MAKRRTLVTFQGTVGPVDQLVVPANKQRVGLILGASNPNQVSLDFGEPAVALTGIRLHTTMSPFLLRIEDIGDTIQKEIRGIGTGGGTSTIGLIEIIEWDD